MSGEQMEEMGGLDASPDISEEIKAPEAPEAPEAKGKNNGSKDKGSKQSENPKESGSESEDKKTIIDRSEPEEITKKPKGKTYRLVHPHIESDAECSMYIPGTNQEVQFNLKNGVIEFDRDGKSQEFHDNEIQCGLIAQSIFDKLISEGWEDVTDYEYSIPEPKKSEKPITGWVYRVYGDDKSTIGLYVGEGKEKKEVSVEIKNNEVSTKDKDVACSLEKQGFRLIRTL